METDIDDILIYILYFIVFIAISPLMIILCIYVGLKKLAYWIYKKNIIDYIYYKLSILTILLFNKL